MRKNLKTVAREVLDQALKARATHWTSRMIQDRFDLDEQQLQTVKQYTKKFAAELGVLWAWDPSISRFRVAPHDTATARGMVDYAYEQWSNSGKSINHLIRGARGQGFVSKHVETKTLARNDTARAAIEAAGDKIRYKQAI